MKIRHLVPLALLVIACFVSQQPSATAHTPEAQAIAQQPQHIGLTGQFGGSVHAVAVHGPYAYAGIGARLAIIGISSANDPHVIGQTDVLPDVVINGQNAYIASGYGGLHIVDISSPAAKRETIPLSGRLSIVWRDEKSVTGITSEPVYILSDETGHSTQLIISDALASANSIWAMNGAQVIVEGEQTEQPAAGLQSANLNVKSVRLASGVARAPTAPTAVLGPQPFVSVLCKFADIADTPTSLAYFDALLGSNYPGLDHYFRTISYGAVNLSGSKAVGWYTVPQSRSYYVYDMDGDGELDLDTTRAAQDCGAAADADVNFHDYAGINFVFNGYFGGADYGGGVYLNLDGANRNWRATWLDASLGQSDPLQLVAAHEMGHSFGLMHSATLAIWPSDWDMMSSSGCVNGIDPLYNCVAQGTISYHLDKLGWMPSGRKYVSLTGSQATITLEQLAQSPSSNYLMAQIPIGGSSMNFYTLEARRLIGYDQKLPGAAVIIHKVDTTRADFQARVVDNYTAPPAGQMWTPGKIFSDTTNGITVCIDRATATGFVVTVGLGVPMTCAFAIDMSPSELQVSTTHPNASESVTFSIVLENWGGEPTAGTIVTATVPNDMTYVPGSAATTQGTVSDSGPLIFSPDTITYGVPVTLTFIATVNPGVSSPTVLNGPVTISWLKDSLSRSFNLIANGLSVYLPLIQR